MNKRRLLVTITDNISSTSMPFNEFVMYRSQHILYEKQIVVLLFKKNIDQDIKIFENLEVKIIGYDFIKLRKYVNKLFNEANSCKTDVIFHIHEAKSVLFFNIATSWKYVNNIIYTLHSTFKNYPFHNKILSFLASLQSHFTICVSETSYKYYPKILKKILKKRAMYIQNGVDIERINRVIKNLERNQNELFTLIYVARFVELKNHEFLFKVLTQIPDVKLNLIGKGKLENKLKLLAKELKIDNRVKFLGYKSRDEVYKELYLSDAYISTSKYEGLPIGVLEAIECKLPCLLSNIEQHKEIAQKYDKLFLIDNRVNDWINLINKIKNNKLLKSGLYKNISNYFSLKQMHENYNKIYQLIQI